jgi:predicted DNA-binding transcriptional regulator YafY
MRERFHLDAPGWFAREEPVPHLAALSRAVWEEQRVEIRYRKRDGEVKRLLDPLGLVLKAGVWYLVAPAGRPRSLRTFRVSRVQAVRLLDEEVQRPDDFDLATHWAAASVDFLGTWQTTPVHVRMPSDLTWLVRYVQDPRSTESALASASAPDAHGWVTLTLQFENLEVAGYELMRLGGDLEVLEPPELRAHLVERATRMVERYSSVPA